MNMWCNFQWVERNGSFAMEEEIMYVYVYMS